MFITDNNGNKIEVIDLDKAVEQARIYSEFMHEDEFFKESDKRLEAYWKDILNKLQKLQSNSGE